MNFTLIKLDQHSSSAINQEIKAKNVLDKIYDVAADRNIDQVLSNIVAGFDDLSLYIANSSGDEQVIDVSRIPVPLQEAIVILIMCYKAVGEHTISSLDIINALCALIAHPKATSSLIRDLTYFQNYNDLENLIADGIALYNTKMDSQMASSNKLHQPVSVNQYGSDDVSLAVYNVLSQFTTTCSVNNDGEFIPEQQRSTMSPRLQLAFVELIMIQKAANDREIKLDDIDHVLNQIATYPSEKRHLIQDEIERYRRSCYLHQLLSTGIALYNAAHPDDQQIRLQNNLTLMDIITCKGQRYSQLLCFVAENFSTLNQKENDGRVPQDFMDALIALIICKKGIDRSSILLTDITEVLNDLVDLGVNSKEITTIIRQYQQFTNLDIQMSRAVERYVKQYQSIAVTVHTDMFQELPLDILFLITTKCGWEELANLHNANTDLNNKRPSIVKQLILLHEQWLQTKKTTQPCLIFRSANGIQYFQEKILNCGPNTLIQLKTGKLSLKSAEEHYEKIDKNNVLKEQLPGHLSSEQFAVLKKYIGDGLFEAAQYQTLNATQQQEVILLLTQEVTQNYIDSMALSDKVTRPITISNLLAFLRLLSLEIVQTLLHEQSVQVHELVNATQGCVYALENGMADYCKKKTTTLQQIISITHKQAQALCTRWVQRSVDFKYVIAGPDYFAESVMNRNVQDRFAYFRSNKDLVRKGDFIMEDELFTLNEDGHKLLRNWDLMELFSKFLTADPNYRVGKKALLECWHILKDQINRRKVTAQHVYFFTTPQLRELLDNGEIDRYIRNVTRFRVPQTNSYLNHSEIDRHIRDLI